MPPNETPVAPGARPPTETMVVMMILAALASGGGIGYYFGKSSAAPNLATSLTETKGTYEEGYAAAKNELEQRLNVSGALPPALPDEISSLSGTITATGASTFKMNSPAPGPREENWVVDREVEVGDRTDIIVLKTKDPEKLRMENEAFLAAQQKSPTAGAKPPAPFEEVAISLSELKTGDYVTVFADRNIKTEPKFLASRVVVGGNDAAPSDAPPPTENR